jgi:hypothetical protein
VFTLLVKFAPVISAVSVLFFAVGYLGFRALGVVIGLRALGRAAYGKQLSTYSSRQAAHCLTFGKAPTAMRSHIERWGFQVIMLFFASSPRYFSGISFIICSGRALCALAVQRLLWLSSAPSLLARGFWV